MNNLPDSASAASIGKKPQVILSAFACVICFVAYVMIVSYSAELNRTSFNFVNASLNPIAHRTVLKFKNRNTVSLRILREPQRAVMQCSHSTADQNRSVSVVILVNSCPEDFAIRSAIRETWAKPADGVEVVFVVGRSLHDNLQLFAEADEFGDLLIADLRESYFNLTLKTYLMMFWAQKRCSAMLCIMKTDHDVIVFKENLLNFCLQKTAAPKKRRSGRIYGFCWDNAFVVRDVLNTKQFVSYEDYKPDVYPKYCSGTGYLLTGSAPRRLYEEARRHAWLAIEDVFFTGIIAESLSLPRISEPGRFSYTKRVDYAACDAPRRLTTHGFKTPNDIRRFWRVFQKQAKQPCENRTR